MVVTSQKTSAGRFEKENGWEVWEKPELSHIGGEPSLSGPWGNLMLALLSSIWHPEDSFRLWPPSKQRAQWDPSSSRLLSPLCTWDTRPRADWSHDRVIVFLQPEFLEAFECGERHAFFDLWHEHIPSSVQSSDPKCQHLECSISAYFAVYPLRTGVSFHLNSIVLDTLMDDVLDWE